MRSKSASQAVLSRMQLTLHAARRTSHGASRLVQPMPVRSVKTRRALSRHCRDATVYGHTPTAMHDMSTRYASPCSVVGDGMVDKFPLRRMLNVSPAQPLDQSNGSIDRTDRSTQRLDRDRSQQCFTCPTARSIQRLDRRNGSIDPTARSRPEPTMFHLPNGSIDSTALDRDRSQQRLTFFLSLPC